MSNQPEALEVSEERWQAEARFAGAVLGRFEGSAEDAEDRAKLFSRRFGMFVAVERVTNEHDTN
jgi:hypothetical protein